MYGAGDRYAYTRFRAPDVVGHSVARVGVIAEQLGCRLRGPFADEDGHLLPEADRHRQDRIFVLTQHPPAGRPMRRRDELHITWDTDLVSVRQPS